MSSLVDFAVLPPELNSGRMYAGVGSGSLLAAAHAWDGLAAELGSAATLYQSVVTQLLAQQWAGPSSASMAEAAAPYVSWISETAARAAQTSSQLKSAVAAYEAAYAATVPPAEIEVNRALLAALVATNVFGQNSSAIAATEAQYTQMWAQDAAAMYGYAGASAAATTLTPFSAPTQNTNPAALAVDAVDAVIVPALLAMLASPPVHVFQSLVEGTLGLGTFSYGVNFLVSGVMLTAAPMIAVCFNPLAAAVSAPATAPTAPEAVSAPAVLASYGAAASVGNLSAPPSWGTKAPEMWLAATASALGLPTTAAGERYGGVPLVSPVANVAPRGERVRSPTRAKVIAGLTDEPGYRRSPDDGPLSERDELNQLRKTASQLAKQRDALKRTAATLIQESKEK